MHASSFAKLVVSMKATPMVVWKHVDLTLTYKVKMQSWTQAWKSQINEQHASQGALPHGLKMIHCLSRPSRPDVLSSHFHSWAGAVSGVTMGTLMLPKVWKEWYLEPVPTIYSNDLGNCWFAENS